MDVENLIKHILDCAVIVRKHLAAGYLEKVYENALAIELRKHGLLPEQQKILPVRYDGILVGDYVADIVVNNEVIIEIKAVRHLNENHEAQLVNYLTTTGIDHGVLLNFGNSDKIEIKRKWRIYKTNLK